MRQAVGLSAVAAQIQPLSADAVYLTPTGRLCRLYAMDRRGGDFTIAKLSYVRRGNDQAGVWSDGFCLAPENWRILTRVG